MDKLFTLLELQRQAQEAESRASLLHIIVNETHKLLPYTHAVFWRIDGLALHLEKASGNAVLDESGAYATALKKTVTAEIKPPGPSATITALNMNGQKGAMVFFKTKTEGLLGGLWLEHDKDYADAEIRILEELAVTYTQSLAVWDLRRSGNVFQSFKRYGQARRYILAGLIVAALFPVRFGITAPAEIIAKKADIVTAPFEGLIEKVHVEPGHEVKAGDILISFEAQSFQAQMDLAKQELEIAQSALSRVQRESLTAPEKKMNLTQLQEDIKAKRISYDFAKTMRDRSDIRAERQGIAVFAEAHSLLGKPVRTGDKLMMIADPADYELLIRVPVDAMVPVQQDADVRFFLNVSPLSGYDASIRSIGYQSSPDADGLLTYKIMADVPKDEDDLRIGWKGTARIKGEWTILSYAVLRRPLIALRNILGV